MRNLLLIFCFVNMISSCKKEEGLSADTGNLEITCSSLPISSIRYSIYTEEQYYLYKSNQFSVPLFEGVGSKNNPISVKALQKGYYGVRVYGEGQAWDKPISIIPNKVNKITFP